MLNKNNRFLLVSFAMTFVIVTISSLAMDEGYLISSATTDDDWQFVSMYKPKISKYNAVIDANWYDVSESVNLYEQAVKTVEKTDAFLDALRAGEFEKQVSRQLAKLKKAQHVLFVLGRRTSPTFAQDVAISYQNNVASVGLDPTKAYEELGVTAEQGRYLSYSYFKKIIAKERNNTATTQQRKNELRQLEYVFSNQATKQEYDAYQNGPQALERLALSAQEADNVQRELNGVIQRYLVLSDLQQTITTLPTLIPHEFAKKDFVRF